MPGVNMSPEELKIAERLVADDPEFKALWDEHSELKTQLKELEEKRFPTPEEAAEIKRIKKLKLAGKDKIAMKINEFKVGVLSSDV